MISNITHIIASGSTGAWSLKALSPVAVALAGGLLLSSCHDLSDDDHYRQMVTTNENAEVIATTMSVADYLQSRSDLSRMSSLFQQQGIYDQMSTSGELHTILVVTDQHFTSPSAETAGNVARSHITNISVAPSRLSDGDRLLMWHDKYVTISTDQQAQGGDLIGHVRFNNATLSEVIKADDGYIYVISDMIKTSTSLQDFINELDDTTHGRFKRMVLSSGGRQFDKAHSKVIGVDDFGNTLYDSVFIYTNEFFDSKNFDLSSEAIKATALIFSDDVIRDAIRDAHDRLHAWGYDHKSELLRNGSRDSVYVGYSSDKDLEDWILQVAFFNRTYTTDELLPVDDSKNAEVNDFKSIYNRVWRTSVQQLDLQHPVELSNGIAYEVTKLRIPNHRLIYRLHEQFSYYEQCDADQKELYFKANNLGNFKVNADEVAPWTPLSGVWPMHGDSPLSAKVADNTQSSFGLDFTPIYSRPNADGGYDVGALLVPPGAYRMAMGFKQGMVNVSVQLFAVDADGELVACDKPVMLPLSDGSTTYHYDRGATLSNRLPEYYDHNDPRLTAGSKNGYYWTDGGPVYTEVIVPDVKGGGQAVQLLIRITSEYAATAGTLAFNHWCLRPTVNNY